MEQLKPPVLLAGPVFQPSYKCLITLAEEFHCSVRDVKTCSCNNNQHKRTRKAEQPEPEETEHQTVCSCSLPQSIPAFSCSSVFVLEGRRGLIHEQVGSWRVQNHQAVSQKASSVRTRPTYVKTRDHNPLVQLLVMFPDASFSGPGQKVIKVELKSSQNVLRVPIATNDQSLFLYFFGILSSFSL